MRLVQFDATVKQPKTPQVSHAEAQQPRIIVMSNFNTRRGHQISAFVTNDAENPTMYDIEGNPTSAELALLAGSAQTVIEEYDGCGKPVFVMPVFDFDA